MNYSEFMNQKGWNLYSSPQGRYIVTRYIWPTAIGTLLAEGTHEEMAAIKNLLEANYVETI